MQRGAGGTPGGLVEFFVGVAMLLVGGYLFMQRLMVSSSRPTFWGAGGTGIALLLLLVGIGVLFFSGKSVLGWLLVGLGGVMIFIGVITNLVVYLMPTSLLETILTLGLVFGGLGLVARGLRPH
jgi:hypothetical protein